jgi:hypothetical protein
LREFLISTPSTETQSLTLNQITPLPIASPP